MGNALEIGQALSRLRKYSADLHQMIEDGSFYRLPFLKRHKLVRRVKKLYNKLLGPVSAIKLKHVLAAAGVIALNTACFQPVEVWPGIVITPVDGTDPAGGGAPSLPTLESYFDREGYNQYGMRPLGGTTYKSVPGTDSFLIREEYSKGYTFVDMDGDGDLDIVHSGYQITILRDFYDESYSLVSYGTVLVWQENTGTAQEPEFGPHQPVNVDSVPHAGGIFFVDIDGDGDQDLLMAPAHGWIPYLEMFDLADQQDITSHGISIFENTDRQMAPAAEGDPVPSSFEFRGTYGYFDLPPWTWGDVAAGDVDGDGDIDILLGTPNGVAFFENTGTPENRQFNFDQPDYMALGLDEVTDYTEYAYQLALVDVDRDGDLDLVAVGRFGTWVPDGYGGFWFSTSYYEAVVVLNDGDGLNPDLTDVFVPEGLYSDYIEGWPILFPRAVDIDGDGDLDAFVFTPYVEGTVIIDEENGYYLLGRGEIHFFENLAIDDNPSPR